MANVHTATTPRARPASALDIGLWLVQTLIALTFTGGAIWKLVTPIPAIAAVFPWAGQVSPLFLYATALFDLLGGLGVLLPSLTRIKPQLTVLAALGCAALQVCAIAFHVVRDEAANTPFNFLLVALAGFVAWGRSSQARIPARA
ncbi:MAG: DoxX family protein [Polyangiaceae bacterium]